MARKKKAVSINVNYDEDLNDEQRNKYDDIFAENGKKTIIALREEAKSMHVDAYSTLNKDALTKRITDWKIVECYPELNKNNVIQPDATKESKESVRGIFDEEDGQGRIDDVVVPRGLVKSAGLRPGDLVEGSVAQNKKVRTLCGVSSVEGGEPNAFRPVFCQLKPIMQRRDLGYATAGTQIGAKAPDLQTGERVIMSGMSLDDAVELATSCSSNIGLFFGITAENLQKVGTDNFVATFDEPQKNVLRTARVALNRAKRLSERGKDVILVVYGFAYIGDSDMERALFGVGRCFEQGSITVIADVKENKDGNIFAAAATRRI